MKDVAKKAGVSVSTVSRVVGEYGYVSESVREKIQNICDELNYKPNVIARSLIKKKTNTIGLIITDIHNPFYIKILDVVEQIANQNGYSILLCNSGESLEKERLNIETLIRRQIDGLIIVPVFEDTDEDEIKESNSLRYKHILDLSDHSIPFIFIDRYIKDIKASAVMLDNTKTAFNVMEKIFKKGFQNILVVINSGSAMNERIEGINSACNKWDIKLNDDNWAECSFTAESAYTAVKSKYKNKHYDVVFALDNAMTLGVLKVMNELNLTINKDVRIIGFDEIDLFNFLMKEKIGVVSQPVQTMSKLATEILIEHIENDNTSDEQKIVRFEGSINI